MTNPTAVARVYLRVSTDSQALERQERAIKAKGALLATCCPAWVKQVWAAHQAAADGKA